MIELSIALVTIAGIAGWLVNKYLDQRATESKYQHELNMAAAQADISAAVDELIKPFDSRINNTWTVISELKQELNTIKLQSGLRNR